MPEGIWKPERQPDRGRVLLEIARRSLAEAFEQATSTSSKGPPAERWVAERWVAERWLAELGATFVTLTEDGELRGCIGSLEAPRPLGKDVWENARAAAFQDPRFAPLVREELPRIAIEVSVLSPAVPLPVRSEAEALARLRPGRDGVVLEYPGSRGEREASATFLPQVWEQLPDPASFLAQLKRKAGLPPGFWSPEIRLSIYEVTKWEEEPSHP
jgi:AmmeMemoRadiSam system protein A